MNNSFIHFRKLLPLVQKNLNAFWNLEKKARSADLVPVHKDQMEGAHTANSAYFDFFVYPYLFFHLFIFLYYCFSIISLFF